MAVSHEYRIPHSEFLSWSTTDRDKSIWWHIRLKEQCSRCGTRPDEWDESVGGYRFAYRGEIIQCEGCARLQRVEEAPEMVDQVLPGLHAALFKNPQGAPLD